MKYLLTLSVVTLIAVACTSYQPKGFTGGFSETQLADNVYRINFSGNAYTSRERTADFAMLRAADLTLEGDFNYFAILDSENWTKTSTHTSSGSSTTNFNAYQSGDYIQGTATTTQTGGETRTINKPRSDVVIAMFNEKPESQGIVYEAKFVRQSIRNKYEITD